MTPAATVARPRPVYFASGSSRPADVRGFSAVHHPIGVAADEVSPAAEAELCRLAGTGLPVFVDSGAFSEVEFGPAGPVVVRPIGHEDWLRRLALYARLARALGPQAYLVAPDRVGDQDETLARLARYRDQLAELRALGARVLVAVQKGAMTQAAFVRRCAEVLGFDDFVHALPSKKNATTLEELAAYVAEVRPAALHLLGMGARNRNAARALALIAAASPETVVSMDSNLIAASVGLRPMRPLSRACVEARDLISRGAGFRSGQEFGIMLAFGSPVESFTARTIATVQTHAEEIFAQSFETTNATEEEFAAWLASTPRPELPECMKREEEAMLARKAAHIAEHGPAVVR